MSEQLISRGKVQAHLIAEWEENVRTNQERADQSPEMAEIFTPLLKQERAQLESLLQDDFEFDVTVHPTAYGGDDTPINLATISYQIGQVSGMSQMDLTAEHAVVPN